MQETTPNKYWEFLGADFDVGAKVGSVSCPPGDLEEELMPTGRCSCVARGLVARQRRVFDAGYYRSLNEPNVELVADDSVERAEGHKVFTRNGREIEADVVILATGFRVRDCESFIRSHRDHVAAPGRPC